VYFRNRIVHPGQQQSRSKRSDTLCHIQCQATRQSEKSLDCWFCSCLHFLCSAYLCEIFYVLFNTRLGLP